MEENTSLLTTNRTTAKDVIAKYRKDSGIVLAQTLFSLLIFLPIVIAGIITVIIRFDIVDIMFGETPLVTMGLMAEMLHMLYKFFCFLAVYLVASGIFNILYITAFARWLKKSNFNLPVVFTNSKKQPGQGKLLAMVALLNERQGAKIFYVISSVFRFIFGVSFIILVYDLLENFILYACGMTDAYVNVDMFEVINDIFTSPMAILLYALLVIMMVHSIVTSAVLGSMRNKYMATLKTAEGDYTEDEVNENPSVEEAKPEEKKEDTNKAEEKNAEEKKDEISEVDLSSLLR